MAAYLWMLLSASSFAGMAVFARLADEQCAWQTTAIARTLLALIFAAILVWLAGVKFVLLRPRILWMRSFCGTVSLVCVFYGLHVEQAPIGDLLTIANMYPLWIAVLTWPLLGERPEAEAWLAIVCGIAGAALIQHHGGQPQGTAADATHAFETNLAYAAAFVSSFASALALIGLHRLRGIDPRAIVVHFSAVAFLVVMGFALLAPRERSLAPPSASAYLLLFAVGASATVGQLLLTKAFAIGVPARVSAVGLTQAMFGVLFEPATWTEGIELPRIIGMGLVLGPTAWLMLRAAARHKAAAEVVAGEVEPI